MALRYPRAVSFPAMNREICTGTPYPQGPVVEAHVARAVAELREGVRRRLAAEKGTNGVVQPVALTSMQGTVNKYNE
jgi:hypothetical protein